MDIQFNKAMFNPIFFEIKEILANRDIRFLFVYGGSSSSKTYSIVQATIINMLQDKDYNTLIFRKFGNTIKDSIYQDFKNIIDGWGLTKHFIIQQNYIKCTLNNNYVTFKGLDNAESIKGLTGFKKIILEELNQFEFDEYKQIRKRLRGKEGQQIIGLFNPISEEHWIKVEIFDKEDFMDQQTQINQRQINLIGDTITLKTNYLDNKYIVGPNFVDKHTIADFEKDKISDYNYYKIYGLGEWGRLRTGGEFLKDFRYDLHVGQVNFNPELPLHISWDENSNPYLPCGIFQIEDKNICMIDEIAYPTPKNTIQDVCNEIMRRYPVKSVQGMFIYGDRTSLKQDTKLEKGQNFFTLILQYLSAYHPTLRLQSVNPSVVQSGGFMNKIFSSNFEGIKFKVDQRCKKAINDFQYCLEASDGTIAKTRKINPMTKVSYQEFGHYTDLTRYITTVAFSQEYLTYLRGGRIVRDIKFGKNYSKNSF